MNSQQIPCENQNRLDFLRGGTNVSLTRFPCAIFNNDRYNKFHAHDPVVFRWLSVDLGLCFRNDHQVFVYSVRSTNLDSNQLYKL
jgi:hypothetical protein